MTEELKWRHLKKDLHNDVKSLNKYQIHSLGTGNFTVGIFKAQSHRKGIIAVKVGKIRDAPIFQRESDLMIGLSHPNIRSLVAKPVLTEKYVYMLLEYVDGCDLFTFISEKTPPIPRRKLQHRISEFFADSRRYILKCVLAGLQYLHENGIIHNDVKLENVVIGTSDLGALTNTTPIKLIDFGLACKIEDSGTRGYGGSESYLAPEKFIDDEPITFAADIFSFGVVFYAIMTLHLPYKFEDDMSSTEKLLWMEKSVMDIRKKVVDEERGLLGFSQVKQILLSTLKLKSRERKTADQLLQCPFFTEEGL